MTETKLRLLEAAREVVGSTDALAARLGTSHAIIERYLVDAELMPDALLLKTIDVLLEERTSRRRI